jgi:CubicO group peptidase (beta-lactamase class C family)
MHDSGYDSNTRLIPRRASGYTPGQGGPTNAGYVDMSVPHAAGALYSTTEDMLRWHRALLGGKVLSATSLQKMLTPERNNYGYGLIVRSLNNRKQVWHNGGINGFNSSAAHYPDSKITIIVLANLNGPVADLLLTQLGAVAHGDAVALTGQK